MNNKASIANALAGLNPLPSPRGAALHMVRMAHRSDVSVGEVIRVAQSDPALCGRLIHAANRLRTDAWSPTGALDVAVQRLGFCAARQIALGFSIVGEYRTGNCSAFQYDRFWTASLFRGLAAQAFAARLGTQNPSDAFVLGLLLEVGRLALATAQPIAYAGLLEHADLAGAGMRAEELGRFGIDHAELGAVLMEQWMLPQETTRSVRDFYGTHETDAAAPAARTTLLLADAVAQAALAPARCASAWTHIALDTAARCGIDAGTLAEIAGGVAAEAAEWAPLLRLPLPRMNRAEFERYGESEPGRGADRALRILLVDDDEDEHVLLRPVLERQGYAVSTANNAEEAVEAILDAPPNMVITDWQMPGMSGPELCRTLRKTRIGECLHLIIRTGRARDEDLVAGIHAGANDFVSKNSAESILLARIQAGARAAVRCDARTAELAAVSRCAADIAVLGLT